MRDEFASSLAELIKDEGYSIHYTDGGSIIVYASKEKNLGIIVWYNPELMVTMHEHGCGKHLGRIALNEPSSIDQILKILNQYFNGA